MHQSFLINKTMAKLLAIVSLVLIFTACSNNSKEKKQSSIRETQRITFSTAPVEFINPEYEITMPGELKPYEQVAIFAKVTGFVKQLYVDRGSHVNKGQLLALLEAPEMNQHYLSEKAAQQKQYSDYLFAKQAYDRLLEASKTTGAVADIELDRARSAMESAKSGYQASKAGTAGTAQLQKYLRITAPFDGIITERNVSAGALAGTGAGGPLFMMAQQGKLRLTLSLPEKHAASVRLGMPVSFTVSSQPGTVFHAKLSRTSVLLNQQDRSLTLEFDVDNPSGNLKGGDYAQVKLKLQRKKPTSWVPNSSVLITQSGTYVMTLNNNEVKRVPVSEGIRLDSLTEIFGNISERDSVILKPSEEIKEGKK